MKNEIIIYQAEETSIRLEVRIEDETVWLTEAQMLLGNPYSGGTLPMAPIIGDKIE